MGFLNKFKFWKKEDTFADLDKQLGTVQTNQTDDVLRSHETGLDLGQQQEAAFPSFSMEHPTEKRMPSFERPEQYESVQVPQQMQSQNVQQQLELVAAKLDTIRVSLESINHRLVAVERALHAEEYDEATAPRRRGVW